MTAPQRFTERDRTMVSFTIACLNWRDEAHRILSDDHASASQRDLARKVLQQWTALEDSIATARPALRVIAGGK